MNKDNQNHFHITGAVLLCVLRIIEVKMGAKDKKRITEGAKKKKPLPNPEFTLLPHDYPSFKTIL